MNLTTLDTSHEGNHAMSMCRSVSGSFHLPCPQGPSMVLQIAGVSPFLRHSIVCSENSWTVQKTLQYCQYIIFIEEKSPEITIF